MDRSTGSGERSKKSLKPSQHVFSRILTNIAAGPLGFRADLGIGPEGEKDPGTSRIVFCDEERKDQGDPVQEASTSGAVVGGDEQGNDLTKASPDDTRDKDEPPVASLVPERDREDNITPTDVTEEVTGGFGSLNAALGIVYTNHEGTTAVRNKIEILLSHIAALETLFATLPGNVGEQRRRDKLIRKLGVTEGQLGSLYGKPGLQPPREPVQGGGDVFGLLEDLQEAISHYQIKREKTIHEERCRLIDPADAAILNNFRCAQAAEYLHGDRNGCMKGTRGAVLDEIELWVERVDKPLVYWLNGLAGTGKSTIAQTIAERMFASGRLGASFFCSRDFLDRSNLQLIFPTLAIQLARKFPEFRSSLVPLVLSSPGIVNESLSHQMEKLIVRPLKKSGVSTVIVIDALDECRDDQPASAILSVLGQFVTKIPNVKFFLTGRPERRIREGFRLPQMAEVTDVFVLHEVEPRQIDGDIRLFFEHSFSTRWRGPEGWPTKEQLDLLCDRAAGLFVYAVATVNFIDHGNNGPREQLDRLLTSSESSAREGKIKLKQGMSLDLLYMTILREAFDSDDLEDDHRIRSVIGAVTLAANPLSPSTIATLLGFPTEGVFLRLLSVHSLLIIREDTNHPVRPFHKSFPDFIIDPTRCTDQRFRVSPPDHHSELLIGCLELMNRRLEKNMCKLSDGVVNSEVGDMRERVEQYIDHSLQYACKSWHKHLVDPHTVPTHAPKVTPVLHRFLEEKVLFWLEVLSVLGSVRDAVDALEAAAKWLEGSPTLELIKDCSRFVTGFFEVISTSALHIYHSALPLSPRTSIIRRLYERYAHPLARIVQGVPTAWDPSTATIKCSDTVESIAWSPCSRFIAISFCREDEVHLLDAVTLMRLKSFQSFTSLYRSTESITFSPEGRSLMWFASEELTSLDIQTGVRVSEIPLGNVFPTSITHSGCGTMVGVLFKESGSSSTIGTYNILSGTLISRHPIDGRAAGGIWRHGDCVQFAAVRPGSITVWEVGFSSQLPPTEVEFFPTPNDFDISSQFLFHPTPPRLASIIREKTVTIWDPRYSKLLLNFVDFENLRSMSFSSDGHFFACGSVAGMAYLWKESPTGYILHRKLLPNGSGREASSAVSFSPNRQSIVTLRDKNLQLWHTTDSSSTSSVQDREYRRTDQFIIAFSPDELLAVAARFRECTATVLDLKSGATQLAVDTNTTIFALGVVRSAIAVAGDGKVITWNLPTGVDALSSRVDSNDSVRETTIYRPYVVEFESVCMSPDLGSFAVAVRSWPKDHYVLGYKIYNASTGIHLEWVESQGRPWFTPDGREFWVQGKPPGELKGWAIVRNSESDVDRLEPLDPTVGPSRGPPWESSHGYQVTDGGWVLNSTGKRLLWLPAHWQSEEIYRRWSGRFLALLHAELLEVVVLELLVAE